MAVEAGVMEPPVVQEDPLDIPFLVYSRNENNPGFDGILPDVVVAWAEMKYASGIYTQTAIATYH